MFVTIETNGATHIAIYVPHAGAEKTLPAIAAMLEQNAVFINKGYQEMNKVKPIMGITLGDRFAVESYDSSIIVAESGAAIGAEFQVAAPDVFTSNAKGLKRRDDELSKLRTELSFVKNERDALKARIDELGAAQDTTTTA